MATPAGRRMLIHHRDGYTLDVADFAQALGHGAPSAQHVPVYRTLRRLVAFDLADFADAATYAVRRRIPPASTSQLCRLSPELQRLHEALLVRHDDERLARRAHVERKA